MKKSLMICILAVFISACSKPYFWQIKPKSELELWHEYYEKDIELAREKLYFCELRLYNALGEQPKDFEKARIWDREKSLFLARLDKKEYIRCQAAAIVVRNADK